MMSTKLRIGLQVAADDYFWVRIREVICQYAEEQGVDIVLISSDNFLPRAAHTLQHWTDELLTLHLDSLITVYVREGSVYQLLEQGVAVVALTESDFHHPLFVAPHGFFDISSQLGHYMSERLGGQGTTLLLGGMLDEGEAGRTRLAGLRAAFGHYPGITLHHLPCLWGYEQAYARIKTAFQHKCVVFDCIIGLTDGLAQAAYDRCRELGLLHENTLIASFNGDPLALAAVRNGTQVATMALDIPELGRTALDLAIQGAVQHRLPASYSYRSQLATRENIEQWDNLHMTLPTGWPLHHFSMTHQRQEQQLMQLQTSLDITYRIGTILDRQQLAHEIAELIRTNYEYDFVQVFRWNEQAQTLQREPSGALDEHACIPFPTSGIFGQVLQRRAPLLLQDASKSAYGPSDTQWQGTQTRCVLPIRLGAEILGLLDLHSKHLLTDAHLNITGLQALADQLGVAMRNAELYQQAVMARVRAEQADRLKTSLLANVSHELRTPLQVILGYCQSLLGSTKEALPPPAQLFNRDLVHIQQNATHLMHLIGDLLDMAQAEIGELKLRIERLHPLPLLQEVFSSLADSDTDGPVAWHLDLPPELPMIEVDPIRLRQILFNLLSNARRWTASGQVCLGATVQSTTALHLWVHDTGCGIAPQQHQWIFEPFVSGEFGAGIGLGLAITRALVALHKGTLTVESSPGRGSTFHVWLPLPSDPQPMHHADSIQPTLPDVSQQLTQIIPKPFQNQELVNAICALPTLAVSGSVLIVEDDQEARELYCRLAARALPNHLIRTAADGSSALSMLEQEVPGLLILDLVMPGIDGFRLLEHLRASSRTSHVPVLILSGRQLDLKDLQRLNKAYVTVQAKGLLSSDETIQRVQQLVGDAPRLALHTSNIVKQAIVYIQQHYMQEITLRDMAHDAGTSRDYLGRIFHQELGLSPWEYLNRYRVLKAKQLLIQSSRSISQIASDVGFHNISYFSRIFHQQTGQTPRTYRLARPPIGIVNDRVASEHP